MNWTITISAHTLAIQLNETNEEADEYNKRINFNGLEDSQAPVAKKMTQISQKYYGIEASGFENSERLRFWLGFSIACGPLHQFQLMRDGTTLQESIIADKRHCGIFIDIPLFEIDKYAKVGDGATSRYYKIPLDITFSGVLDLNQLNPIFNSFPVLTRNYASLHLQLWIQDYLQDLKVVFLIKQDTVRNYHLVHRMIPPEKLDIVNLLSESTEEGIFNYKKFNVQIVNMQNAGIND
ncbi:MAG: hypothetical protein EZS28_011014 [Streblomastix strix]|uniref:Uncharacterized protein n=1 Tax=Streblomastix strix TaxID=222440 RepID=A0A5J4WEW7_9EUKA|nr:MAG: hypothetical protein EZS28_011014 [Streblomastix strix]